MYNGGDKETDLYTVSTSTFNMSGLKSQKTPMSNVQFPELVDFR